MTSLVSVWHCANVVSNNSGHIPVLEQRSSASAVAARNLLDVFPARSADDHISEFLVIDVNAQSCDIKVLFFVLIIFEPFVVSRHLHAVLVICRVRVLSCHVELPLYM